MKGRVDGLIQARVDWTVVGVLAGGRPQRCGALWEVNDSAAPEIMDTFYGEMSRGQDAASALRAAKLALLKSKDPEIVFRKPFYWAAFQLYAGS